MKLTSQTTESL